MQTREVSTSTFWRALYTDPCRSLQKEKAARQITSKTQVNYTPRQDRTPLHRRRNFFAVALPTLNHCKSCVPSTKESTRLQCRRMLRYRAWVCHQDLLDTPSRTYVFFVVLTRQERKGLERNGYQGAEGCKPEHKSGSKTKRVLMYNMQHNPTKPELAAAGAAMCTHVPGSAKTSLASRPTRSSSIGRYCSSRTRITLSVEADEKGCTRTRGRVGE